MNQLPKICYRFFSIAFKICNKFRKRYAGLLLLLAMLSNNPSGSAQTYHASYTPVGLLTKLLDGNLQANSNSVKWSATPGDTYEFNAQLGADSALYSIVDTTMVIERENEKIYHTIFRTAPMIINEEGEFVNANRCHVCGVNLGYFSYTIEKDSIYVQKFKRSFATHGSFGEKSYTLSMINLGDGYELVKVDDPYEGMGINSITTRFYQDGELMLSMISEENNRGNRSKNQKGYYEFKTDFVYSGNSQIITAKQTGCRIDEKSGKRIPINKIKKLKFDNYTLKF